MISIVLKWYVLSDELSVISEGMLKKFVRNLRKLCWFLLRCESCIVL